MTATELRILRIEAEAEVRLLRLKKQPETTAQKPKVKPSGSTKAVISDMDVQNIFTDEKRFQNRFNAFSEDSKNRIIRAVENGTFDWAKFDPIIVWRDSGKQKFFVLSGHSRLAAFKELAKTMLEFAEIPVKIFKGTEEQAVETALMSNTLATKETDVERAVYWANRRKRCEIKKGLGAMNDCEKKIEQEVKDAEGKNANYILNLSYLNPTGFVIDSLNRLGVERDNESTNTLRTIANWIGEARRFNKDISDIQETEIAQFLLNGGYGNKAGQFKNKATFNERLKYSFDKWKAAGSDPMRQLNLANTLSKSSFEQEFDARLESAKQELAQATAEHEEKYNKYLNALIDGKITQERMDELMKPLVFAVKRASDEVNRIREQKGEVMQATRSQTSLFGISEKHLHFCEFLGWETLVFSSRGIGSKSFNLVNFKSLDNERTIIEDSKIKGIENKTVNLPINVVTQNTLKFIDESDSFLSLLQSRTAEEKRVKEAITNILVKMQEKRQQSLFGFAKYELFWDIDTRESHYTSYDLYLKLGDDKFLIAEIHLYHEEDTYAVFSILKELDKIEGKAYRVDWVYNNPRRVYIGVNQNYWKQKVEDIIESGHLLDKIQDGWQKDKISKIINSKKKQSTPAKKATVTQKSEIKESIKIKPEVKEVKKTSEIKPITYNGRILTEEELKHWDYDLNLWKKGTPDSIKKYFPELDLTKKTAVQQSLFGLLHGLEFDNSEQGELLGEITNKSDVYDYLTNLVIEMIEQKPLFWRKTWKTKKVGDAYNFISKKQYSGVNDFMLNYIAPLIYENAGYTEFSDVYMTFKQVKEKKGTIRKGAKSMPVYYYNFLYLREVNGKEIKITEDDYKFLKNQDRSRQDLRVIPYLKYYSVFNAVDIEGIDFPEEKKIEKTEREQIESCEFILNSFGDKPQIKLSTQDRAFYSPSGDYISVPKIDFFDTEQEYYAALFHELAHSTGHSSRLSRNLSGTFGTKEYAFEELVAEFTALFLCADAGIAHFTLENSAAYIKGWNSKVAELLKADSKAIFRAAAAAQKAKDYILVGKSMEDFTPKPVTINKPTDAALQKRIRIAEVEAEARLRMLKLNLS